MNIYDLKGKEYINTVEITAEALWNNIIELDKTIYKLNDAINKLEKIAKTDLQAKKELEILISTSDNYEKLYDDLLRSARIQMKDLELNFASMSVLNNEITSLRISQLYSKQRKVKPISKSFIKKIRTELLKILPKERISKAQFILYFKQAVINLTNEEDEILYPSPKKTASYLIKTKKIEPVKNGYKLK